MRSTDPSPDDAGSPSAAFLADVPVLTSFIQVADPASYRTVPSDWWMGLTDIVGSTKAGRAGRFKAVNAAGASAISGMMNETNGMDFPFVFGGDGCAFLVPAECGEAARDVLSRTAAWVRDDLALELRVALAPVADIEAAGHTVDIAYFQASDHVRYAMFRGGGLRWAEDRMKDGRFLIPAAGQGQRPDLTGLSCRWTRIKPEQDTILSLIVVPCEEGGVDQLDQRFSEAVSQILAIATNIRREGRPAPEGGPGFMWPPEGLDLEARASRGDNSLFRQKLTIGAITLLAWFVDQIGKPVGGFDPLAYRTNTSKNADYRKYDDGLHLTLDCDQASEKKLLSLLNQFHREKILRYGLHRQGAALMTCIVPSIHSHAHYHFIDGAEGGYTQAATSIKNELKAMG